MDTSRGVRFWTSFSALKRRPNTIFNPTPEEVRTKFKQTSLEKYGVENPFQSKEIKEKIKKTMIKRYGVENPAKSKETKEKTKKTNLERYGVEHASQSEWFRDKVRKTNLERYGHECSLWNKSIREKTKKTNLLRYGVENYQQNKEVQDKVKKTNLERYGAENPFGSKEIKEKIKQTNIERYGVEHPIQNKDVQEKIKQTRIKKGLTKVVDGKTILEWSKEKGLASRTTLGKAANINIHPSQMKARKSLLEERVKEHLDELEISYIHNKKLPEHEGMNSGFLRPDFLLSEHNLIIECDGEHWHQDKERDERRNKTYTDLGYDVLCFSGTEIMRNWELVKRNILAELIRGGAAHV